MANTPVHPALAEAGVAVSLIVNIGSKQGVTTPPGDAAYNVSKAGVKVFTESRWHPDHQGAFAASLKANPTEKR